LLPAIEKELPRPPRTVEAVIPYDRGDLISRAHREGEVLEVEHQEAGTRLRARVHEGLAAALEPYAVASAGR
jgi:GTPase